MTFSWWYVLPVIAGFICLWLVANQYYFLCKLKEKDGEYREYLNNLLFDKEGNFKGKVNFQPESVVGKNILFIDVGDHVFQFNEDPSGWLSPIFYNAPDWVSDIVGYRLCMLVIEIINERADQLFFLDEIERISNEINAQGNPGPEEVT